MSATALLPASLQRPEAPVDEAGIAAAIRAASAAGEPLLVGGNGSKAGLMRPVQAARGLSTRALSGISLYSPNELIISAGAGTPLAEMAAAVAANGQHIISEPPDFSALLASDLAQTIGGVVATNLSGPRRVAWGATRDHVMGVRAVNGIGETIHSGGRVLKNVTGLDLCKLLTGSHGTLAVLTEITLKVLPAPERRGTLVLSGLDPVQGVAALAAALGSPYAVSGAAYLPQLLAARIPSLAWFKGPVAVARIEDFGPSVAYRCDRLRADLAAFGHAELLDDGASRATWEGVRDATPLVGEDGAIWRVSVRPSAGPAVAAAVAAAFDARWFLDWGGGLVWIAGPASEAAHHAVETAARAAGGTWMLFRAPEGLRAAVDVIPPEIPALARITRAVKAAFDPKGILNPGRLYRGL
jgi:glycolate oxidase FAD binding subunit